jgi:hypothetical protein
VADHCPGPAPLLAHHARRKCAGGHLAQECERCLGLQAAKGCVSSNTDQKLGIAPRHVAMSQDCSRRRAVPLSLHKCSHKPLSPVVQEGHGRLPERGADGEGGGAICS